MGKSKNVKGSSPVDVPIKKDDDKDLIITQLQTSVTQLSKKLKQIEFFLSSKFAEDFVAAIQESSIADDVNDYNITTFEEFYVDDTDDENDNHNDDNTQHKDKQAGCRSSRFNMDAIIDEGDESNYSGNADHEDFDVVSEEVHMKIKEEKVDENDDDCTVPSPTSSRAQRALKRSTRIKNEKRAAEESESEHSESEETNPEKPPPKISEQDKPTSATCEICSRVFAGRYFFKNLKAHMDTHSSELKYKCPHCPKRYRLHRPLRTHIVRIHEADKRSSYECKYCPRKFAIAPERDKHMRVHTGEKPYTCEICGHSFSQKANMDRHKLCHEEKSVLCQECGKKYRCKVTLKTHIKRMHSAVLGQDGKRVKQFVCEVCPSSFHNKDSKLRHLRKMHNIYSPKNKATTTPSNKILPNNEKNNFEDSSIQDQPSSSFPQTTEQTNDSQDFEKLEKEINLD